MILRVVFETKRASVTLHLAELHLAEPSPGDQGRPKRPPTGSLRRTEPQRRPRRPSQNRQQSSSVRRGKSGRTASDRFSHQRHTRSTRLGIRKLREPIAIRSTRNHWKTRKKAHELNRRGTTQYKPIWPSFQRKDVEPATNGPKPRRAEVRSRCKTETTGRAD